MSTQRAKFHADVTQILYTDVTQNLTSTEFVQAIKKLDYYMTASNKLMLIKSIHTLIWVFFNIVIFYFLYAVIINKIDKWVWICIALVCLEGIVLAVNKVKCPLTIVAEKYSDSQKANFDIYLPNWLAKYNKEIYTSIFFGAVLLLFYRLLNN